MRVSEWVDYDSGVMASDPGRSDTKQIDLLARVVNRLTAPGQGDELTTESVLLAAAARYGSHPEDEDSFDASAAALFEAVVESAFLVANADGDFDQREREAFAHLVTEACGRRVAEKQLAALIEDLAAELEEDGLEHRLSMVGRGIAGPEHRRDTLRIAALLAAVSSGVSGVERRVLEGLAQRFDAGPGAVDTAIAEAEAALLP